MTKLNDETIALIAEYARQRLNWQQISDILNINPGTIRGWLNAGRKAKSGKKKALVSAVKAAEAEAIADAAKLVMDAVKNGVEEHTTKTVELQDGSIRRETITKTKKDPHLALKVLERLQPEVWAPTKYIQVDWRGTVQNYGIDPETVEKAFMEYMTVETEAEVEDEVLMLEGETA